MIQILRISILTAMVSIAWSQTTGKISGTVQGDDGKALAGANVEVVGTVLEPHQMQMVHFKY